MRWLVTVPIASIIVVIVLGTTYYLIVSVALFHPDSTRRKTAERLLRGHRFARKPKK
jgi:hypothetical protein